jgi:lysophospholipase L1-like esterase
MKNDNDDSIESGNNEKPQFVSTTPVKNILAFGDSLTEGYYRFGTKFHPYSLKLESLLVQHGAFDVMNLGHSGEETWQMVRRLEQILQRSFKYDYVCILGGTNDLADSSETSSSIFGRLQVLYEKVLACDSKLIVVTIPPTAFDSKEEDYLKTKLQINEMIHEFYLKHKEMGKVEYVDLYSAVPYYESNGSKSPLWDDNLHLSPAGYDKFGELVYESLKRLL